MKTWIASGLEALALSPPPEAVQQLHRYGELLLEQNQHMNLTAITQPQQVATLHFLDSAALLKVVPFQDKQVIDVGTGAGFPGLPLRLLEPSIRLTLLDSLGKRVAWLAEICSVLGTSDVTCLHARAEEQALVPGFRDAFDIATSRAVAPLNLLCELCLPYVKVGGCFLAMKSVDCDQELAAAAPGLSRLGGTLRPSVDYAIPHTDVVHRVVVVEKTAPTPKGYPRRWAKIQKAPL